MKRTKKLSQPIYNLLIKNKLDRFTVLQARDELQNSQDRFQDDNEARKYIYRQVSSLVLNGYLKTTGKGRNKLYIKTDAFFLGTFACKTYKYLENEPNVMVQKNTDIQNNNYIATLKKERLRYQSEFSIASHEKEEFDKLMERFPDKQELLMPVFEQIKGRSEMMLGKINAITAALKVIQLPESGFQQEMLIS
ncbi:hypothetical protein F9817_16220 [Vibrio sp. CAIM 722]|uniref:Transcriptional regulator VspR n=1 Tax=Vibrio eleionomae TaxID=2653505 RepID=A0A7X4LMK1_9VIBR|nr:hypothetical protein [Vibrio eleionomae]MZI94727.1 hypothetical protein [Vibrio eleionomae]